MALFSRFLPSFESELDAVLAETKWGKARLMHRASTVVNTSTFLISKISPEFHMLMCAINASGKIFYKNVRSVVATENKLWFAEGLKSSLFALCF